MDYEDNEIIAQIIEELKQKLARWRTEIEFYIMADGYLYLKGYRNLFNDTILIEIPK